MNFLQRRRDRQHASTTGTPDLAALPRPALCEWFTDVLTVKTRERDQNGDWVPGPDGRDEVAWVLTERDTMLQATNRVLTARGLPETTLDRLRVAERRAVGHVDYVKKFGIGCADIVAEAQDAATEAPVGFFAD